MTTTIYIELEDEAVVCWRPLQAEHVSGNVYRICGAIPEEEVWRFRPGSLVVCQERRFASGPALAAVEAYVPPN